MNDEERKVAVTALIDSGCTSSCINKGFVERAFMTKKKLQYPIPARNADGSINSNGMITKYVNVTVQIGDHREIMELPIVNLGKDDLFLGHDWLRTHNPSIDWRNAEVIFSDCPKECGMREPEKMTENVSLEQGEKLLQITFDFDTELRIRAFETKSTAIAQKQQKSKIKLPPQYKEFADVFAKESFDALPERRVWDHAIKLIPGADTKINAKVYPLNPEEQKQLDEFLKENLESGRIRTSKSELASSFFLMKKKDGKLRPVQDYQKLNDITIKNRYPLPLISEIMNRLKDTRYFSKFDIRWGYNNVRIKEGDEWKAAFRTNCGLFEPLVMFFGLTNSPATFQAMMDKIFRDLVLAGKVLVYMDDILVFSYDLEEHRKLVREVLKRLRINQLYLKLEKSAFEQTETDFLGVIVGKGECRMDPIKTKAIDEWNEPRNLKEMRSFVQFCNFYWNFIPDFATITKAFNVLTKKNHPWEWNDEHRRSYQALKDAVRQNVVLKFPVEGAKYRLECDVSNIACGAVLHQIIDGKPRPLGFFSKTLDQAERNYQIYDKELLAVILALRHWRHLLMGAPKFEIWSDHRNLTYYREAQNLTRRQARWYSELGEYDFDLHHQAGKLNQIADFLSRGGDLKKGVKDNENIVMLKPEIFRPLTFVDDEGIMEEIRKTKEWDDKIKTALKNKDENYKEMNRVVIYKGLVYVLKNRKLREKIIAAHHDTIIAGHPGQHKTTEYVTRNYWWPTMSGQIARYCVGCIRCQESKPRVGTPAAPLNPHEIPSEPWQNISVDFIDPLSESRGYKMIMVVVDMLTKEVIIEPCSEEISGRGTAELLFKKVVMKKGLFRKITSDRGPQFVLGFMKELWEMLGTKTNLSTAFHPQTDGQTERLNQEVEKYLRIFIDERQTDWADWLPMAEFALNNRKNRSTGYSPFFLNHGRHPYDGFSPKKIRGKNDSAKEFAKRIAHVMDDAKAALKQAQEKMKEGYDAHRRPAREYRIGDKVWVENNHIQSTRPNKKLNSKRYGPFKVVKKEGASAYRVALPPHWRTRLHPVFNESLLTPFVEPVTDIQQERRPPPLREEEGGNHYEVEKILDCCSRRYGRHTALQYLVKWKGYPHSENSWEKEDSVKGAPAKVKEFHRTHPSAPKPPTLRSLEIPLNTFPANFFKLYGRKPDTEPTSLLLPTEQLLNRLAIRARS